MSANQCDDWKQTTPVVALLHRAKRASSLRRWSIAIRICVWLYLLGVVTVWLLIRFTGDRWWLATVMLFGPRWFYGLPLAVLLPGAVLLQRRLLWPLMLSAILVIWPIMGLCLPWGRAVAAHGPTIRVLTCNVDGGHTRPDAVRRLIGTVQPDIVALQECCGESAYDWPDGWHVREHGELLVASRYPVGEVQKMDGPRPGHIWPRATLLHCVISTPDRDIDFCCIHLPSPRYGISAVLDRSTVLAPSRSRLVDEEACERGRQSDETARRVEIGSTSVILAGDFNMPTDSPLYRRTWNRYRNAFSTSGCGFGSTMRPNVHGWRFGIRIDHILTGSDWWPRRCWIGPDVGSEHLPLVADLAWIGDGDGS